MKVALRAGLLLALLAGPAMAQDKVSRADMALHQRLLTLDTHLDTSANLEVPGWKITDNHSGEGAMSQVDVPRMKSGGLDGGFWVIFMPQGAQTPEAYHAIRDRALIRAARIREMVAANPKVFDLATTAADAERIVKAGRSPAYMSIENSYPLGDDLSLLETFYKLGVRMAGPVHTAGNQLADSANDTTKRWGGLSPLGKQWVAEANRLGIVVDGSHASDEVLEQMIALSKTPVILSHSGPKAVYDHPRNIDDALMKKLADAGGVMQVNSMYLAATTSPPERRAELVKLRDRREKAAELDAAGHARLLADFKAFEAKYPLGQGTFEDFMAALLHALKVMGPDHVGLGADWDGGGGLTGMESIADLPKITARLKAAGYSEADLQKIWSGNVLRLMKAAEDYRDSAASSVNVRP